MNETENRFLIFIYGLGYRFDLAVEHWLSKHNLTEGKWYKIHGHFYAAESRYNCRLDRDLGRRVKQDDWTYRIGKKLIKTPYRKMTKFDLLYLKYAYKRAGKPFPLDDVWEKASWRRK